MYTMYTSVQCYELGTMVLYDVTYDIVIRIMVSLMYSVATYVHL